MADQAARWRASEVVAATEIPVDVFRRWLDRKLLVLDGADIDPGGSGRPRMFGARSVYRVAIVHRLVRAGLNPASALSLANNFCDTSQPGRLPGALFTIGRTLLVASPDGTSKIINLPLDSFVDDILGAEVSIVIDLGRIIEGVNARLGLGAARNRNVDAILNEFKLKVTHV
jgi:hypothetical protein